ncbi:MAG: TonB family protein [Brevundimonas sp.]
MTTEDGVVIRNASWVTAPRPDYPRRAQDQGVESGSVQLECRVLVNGLIGNCTVVHETPPGVGFADAAIAAARASRLRPREVDGVPVEGSIRFTTRFSVR